MRFTLSLLAVVSLLPAFCRTNPSRTRGGQETAGKEEEKKEEIEKPRRNRAP
jgi:hypothetical protein